MNGGSGGVRSVWAAAPIKVKILALVLVALAFPFALSVVLIRANHGAVESFSEDVDAWAGVNSLRSSNEENSRLLGAFLERGSFADLNGYNESVDRFVAALAASERRVDDLESEFLLHSIRNSFESWYDEAHVAVRGRIAGYNDPFAAYYRAQRISRFLDGYVSALMDRVLVEGTRAYRARLDRAGAARAFAVAAMLACAGFCVALGFFLSDQLTIPLRRLSAAAARMAGGDLAIEPVRIEGEDEVGALSASFNAMNAHIASLVQDLRDKASMERKLHREELRNVKTEKLLRESEFLALQARINPHFLFNALSSISRDVMLRDGRNSVALVDSLAALLRYGLDQGSGISDLAAELEIVRKYAFIQDCRFQGRIAVRIECAVDSPESVRLPAFSVQPLVENAFIHGLEPKEEGGTIIVSARMRGRAIVVTVSDDGIGIGEERIQAIKRRKELAGTGHLSSIGLSNVRDRLKLFTGDPRSFAIRSGVSSGTVAEILLREPSR